MSKETSKTESIENPNYSMRWHPDFRYLSNKMINTPLKPFEQVEPSVTDKEAYRVTLASLRGELAQGSGKIDVGQYSIPAGKEYDPNFDFSFLNRKDLTIVELDDHIKIMKRQLEEADSELSERIKAELANAESKRQTLETEQKNENDKVTK